MKKEYTAPEMETMEISCQNELLFASGVQRESPDNDDMY